MIFCLHRLGEKIQNVGEFRPNFVNVKKHGNIGASNCFPALITQVNGECKIEMINKVSKIFCPVLVTPKNAVVKNVEKLSRSQKLMSELGLIRSCGNGTFQIMPIAQRVIERCAGLVDICMRSIDAQKISLPILTNSALWRKSGRLSGDVTEFFMLRDRVGKEFLLSPTHEEAVTEMLAASAPISYRHVPLRLYQIGPKFRDELKPRFGLMRAKEFLMKDLYTFDSSRSASELAYKAVNEAYNKLFERLEVPFVRVEASAGMMGGLMSHEFHYISNTGEDRLLRCEACGSSANEEVTSAENICPNCKGTNVTSIRGIEVAHAFLLGDKYSKPLNAMFLNKTGKPEPLIMGCYGIGVSRLVAAALEVLSTETELRWPTLLAPFDVCIIGPKAGSKEQRYGDIIENQLCEVFNNDDCLNDDRKELTIGKRLMDAKRMGYPNVVVIGAKCREEKPTIELHTRQNMYEVEPKEAIEFIASYRVQKARLLDFKINYNESPTALREFGNTFF